MTVKELKEALAHCDDDMEVWRADSYVKGVLAENLYFSQYTKIIETHEFVKQPRVVID